MTRARRTRRRVKTKIYVAGPYSAPTLPEIEANVQRAIDITLALARAGHSPYCPHLTHYLEQRALETGGGLPYEWYLNYDRIWLRHCETLFKIAPSPGADSEEALARELGLPVYTDLNDIPRGLDV